MHSVRLRLPVRATFVVPLSRRLLLGSSALRPTRDAREAEKTAQRSDMAEAEPNEPSARVSERALALQLLAAEAALETEARQRLLEAGIAAEFPSAHRWKFRATTLIPTISAATAVVLLVLQLYLGAGTLQ